MNHLWVLVNWALEVVSPPTIKTKEAVKNEAKLSKALVGEKETKKLDFLLRKSQAVISVHSQEMRGHHVGQGCYLYPIQTASNMGIVYAARLFQRIYQSFHVDICRLFCCFSPNSVEVMLPCQHCRVKGVWRIHSNWSPFIG